jgi:hypothetical protein
MKKYVLLLLIITSVYSSCKKDEKKEYTYDLKLVTVKKDGNNKQNQKTTTEFISIAYSDIFGTTITSSKLVNLSLAYDAFGDKKLIEDLVVRNFLADTDAQIPSQSEMNANVEAFINSTYQKLLNRQPNEFELWNMKKIIQETPGITPELFYYAILTSNEYRYY